MPSATHIQTEIESWLDKTIIGLNLCPFASRPRELDQIHIYVSNASSTEELLCEIVEQCFLLEQTDPGIIETTIIATDRLLKDWDDYLDALALAEAVIANQGFDGKLQIASFHPLYQFQGTQPEDRENLSNRSPYPLFHLLRESSVENAILAFGDTGKIPLRNADLLNSLDSEQISNLFGIQTPTTKISY